MTENWAEATGACRITSPLRVSAAAPVACAGRVVLHRKKLYRLYKEEKLTVRKRGHRRCREKHGD